MIGIYQQEGLDFFNLIERDLKKHLNLPSQPGKSFKVPQASFNPLRNQCEADAIIKMINENNKNQFDIRVVIVDVDIYARGMNFIFGQADPIRKSAIVSIYRLTGVNMTERLGKEIIHEIYHLLGLGHCSNPLCVMYFSNTIADTDKKGLDLCNDCRRKIDNV